MRSKEAKVKEHSHYYLYQPSATASRLYLYPIALGYFEYETGYSLWRNSYDSFLLMYLIKGSCLIQYQNEELRVSSGNFILLDCYQPHGYCFDEDSDVLWLHFDGPLARSYYELLSVQGIVFSPSNPSPVIHNMEKLVDLFKKAMPIKEYMVSDRITQILNALLNSRSQAKTTFSHSEVIDNSLIYISKHFSEHLTMEALAANSNMSLFHFTRIFSAETGYTPYQYLIATRINSAKYLLRTPDLPIKDIAFSSGFSSESSFCSTFKKWEHMTPSQFRSSIFSDSSL